MTRHFSVVLRNPRPEEDWNPGSGPFYVYFTQTMLPWRAAKWVREAFFQAQGWDIEVRINPTGRFGGWITIWRNKAEIYGN